MQPVSLFDLAAQQARWLSVRQSAVAGNIANVNTPGYHSVDVEPFQSVLDNTRVTLAATSSGHIRSGATAASLSVGRNDDKVALVSSDNTVKLEDELIKSGEVHKAFELNTAIVKAFHRMMMSVVRT